VSLLLVSNGLVMILFPRTNAESFRQSPSWVAIRYMVCEVQYGGRVTDDYDRRLLSTIGERYFKEQAMKLGSNSSEYPKGYCPKLLADISAAKSFVESLPHDDLPEVFGLHPNAELSVNMINSGKMFADFVEIQPKDIADKGSMNFEEIVLGCCSELVRNMPSDFSPNHYDTYKKKVVQLISHHSKYSKLFLHLATSSHKFCTFSLAQQSHSTFFLVKKLSFCRGYSRW
jgi:hypothetical protein